MKLYKAFRDCQPQSGALFYAVRRRRNLAEFFKDRCMVFAGYANPRIAHTEADVATIRLSINLHVTAHWRKFHGVAQEVVKNLLETGSIPIGVQRRGRVTADIDFFCFG